MHSLVYRIAKIQSQGINVNNCSKTPGHFRWHKASTLFSETDPVSTEQLIVSGVCLIKDVNCESTLRAVQQAIHNGIEFCVCSNTNFEKLKTGIALSTSSGEAACFHCTSAGSSGAPKTIRRTHQSWINSFRINQDAARLSSADSYAIVGKLSHSLALYAAMEAMWLGADVHAMSELRADKQFDAMHRWQSTVLYATPTQLRQLCKSSCQTVNSIKHIFSGGGKLDQNTKEQLASHFPNASVKEFYGAAETSFITISDEQSPIESVGRLYPEVQVNITPVDVQHPAATPMVLCEVGEIGEIWVKSPYLFEQYSDEKNNESTDTNTRWQDGYLCIGELGYLDKSGHLYLRGRRSRLVNVADNLVNPEQAEAILNNHPAVHHCAVVAQPDARRGSVLVGVVEAVQNEALKLELLQRCRRELGSLASPRDILFVQQLPMLTTGKPDLQTIALQLKEQRINE